jgi:hypothetical protein
MENVTTGLSAGVGGRRRAHCMACLTMKGIVLFLVVLSSFSRPARADEGAGHAIGVAVGYSSSNVGPASGGLVSIDYSRSLSGHWSWLLRPELVLNLQHPDGRFTKGGALGVDSGLAWASSGEGVRLLGEATLGARLFAEPGAGVAARVGAGIGVPLALPVLLVVGLSGELGGAKVGDERPRTQAVLRVDLWTRIDYRF